MEVPKCELCQQEYNATLTIGERKVCHNLLFEKIRELSLIQLSNSFLYLIGSIIAVWVLLNTLAIQVLWLLEVISPLLNFGMEEVVNVRAICTELVFPIVFLNSFLAHIRKMSYLWEDSYVQLVELVLDPQDTIKE